jgi:hypothetical protein
MQEGGVVCGGISSVLYISYYNPLYYKGNYNKERFVLLAICKLPFLYSILHTFVAILQQTRTIEPKTIDKYLNRVYYNVSYYISIYII